MKPFTSISSVAVPLIRDNIDTDIIIPSREIRSVSKKGLSAGLFANWRYLDPEKRQPDPEFVLNDPAFKDAQILLGGDNFGCGSSREHAVWALSEYGFRAVIARSFSPIFRGNCVRNGILPVALDAGLLAEKGALITIDLPARKVSTQSVSMTFQIDEESATMLEHGLDPIGLTLQLAGAIQAHEKSDKDARPWAWSGIAKKVSPSR